MKEKILMNVRIIDPSQKMDEIGNIVIDEKGFRWMRYCYDVKIAK